MFSLTSQYCSNLLVSFYNTSKSEHNFLGSPNLSSFQLCDPLLLNMGLGLFNIKEHLKWNCKKKDREDGGRLDKHQQHFGKETATC